MRVRRFDRAIQAEDAARDDIDLDQHDDAPAGDGLGLNSLAFDAAALVNGSGDTAFDAAELLSSTEPSASNSTSSFAPASVATSGAFYGGDVYTVICF